jgi:hypothetical protein
VDPESSRKRPAAAGLKTAVIVGGIDMMTQAGLPICTCLHMLAMSCADSAHGHVHVALSTSMRWLVSTRSGARTGGYARKKAARDRRHAWPSD